MTHGISLPMINWGGSDVRAAWISSGFLMNRAAVDLVLHETAYHQAIGTIPVTYLFHIVGWLLQSGHRKTLNDGLSGQREVEGPFVAMLEMAFAASFRAQHTKLLIR